MDTRAITRLPDDAMVRLSHICEILGPDFPVSVGVARQMIAECPLPRSAPTVSRAIAASSEGAPDFPMGRIPRGYRTVRDVCKMSGVQSTTVTNAIKKGTLQARKQKRSGGGPYPWRYVIALADAEAFASLQRARAASRPGPKAGYRESATLKRPPRPPAAGPASADPPRGFWRRLFGG